MVFKWKFYYANAMLKGNKQEYLYYVDLFKKNKRIFSG